MPATLLKLNRTIWLILVDTTGRYVKLRWRSLKCRSHTARFTPADAQFDDLEKTTASKRATLPRQRTMQSLSSQLRKRITKFPRY